MSITPELRASARATYRLLFRTASNKFRGDDRVLNAFREKVRTEFRDGRSITEVSAYNARIQLGREVAEVLKKNIVQGVKVDGSSGSTSAAQVQSESTVRTEDGVWRLRLTEDTELGSNDSIKPGSSPGPSSSQGSGGRQGCCQTQAQSQSSASASAISSDPESSLKDPSETLEVAQQAEREYEYEGDEGDVCESGNNESFEPADSQSQAKTPKKHNFSTLKRLSQNRVKPVLKEDDIEESFVRGSGPGGQSINKTANNVQLLHKPTGIRVTCQETRSLQTNRMIARQNLLEKLDQIANPGLSKEDLKRAKQVERERRRRKKAKKKARKKLVGEALEDEEDLE